MRKPPQAMRATVLPERSVVMRKAFPVLLTVSIRAEVSSFFPSCAAVVFLILACASTSGTCPQGPQVSVAVQLLCALLWCLGTLLNLDLE